jgi:hypothetical protein
MKKVYGCSPFRVPDAVRARGPRAVLSQQRQHHLWAVAIARMAFEQGYLPVIPHIYLPQFVADDLPTERSLALQWGLEWLEGCDQVWALDVPPSEGMQGELDRAAALGIPVVRIPINDLPPVSRSCWDMVNVLSTLRA